MYPLTLCIPGKHREHSLLASSTSTPQEPSYFSLRPHQAVLSSAAPSPAVRRAQHLPEVAASSTQGLI